MNITEFELELMMSILNTVNLRHKLFDGEKKQILKNQELIMLSSLNSIIPNNRFIAFLERYKMEVNRID